jgi:hypothetical protein
LAWVQSNEEMLNSNKEMLLESRDFKLVAFSPFLSLTDNRHSFLTLKEGILNINMRLEY